MYRTIKRFVDFIVALLGIVFISPLLVPLMILLRFSGEGEVFYFQNRMGYKNKTFNIIKFATMLKDSLSIGSKTVTLRNDPRITPLGKYLRFSKLNELPQIFNVLKGDMSFVGPRPLLVSSFHKYKIEVQEVIYQNRPGITGLGSLVFRDEEKLISAVKSKGLEPLEYYKNHVYPYKGQLELWYLKNSSFFVDLAILFLTFWSLVNPKSTAVYNLFKSLPHKPESLTLTGVLAL